MFSGIYRSLTGHQIENMFCYVLFIFYALHLYLYVCWAKMILNGCLLVDHGHQKCSVVESESYIQKTENIFLFTLYWALTLNKNRDPWHPTVRSRASLGARRNYILYNQDSVGPTGRASWCRALSVVELTSLVASWNRQSNWFLICKSDFYAFNIRIHPAVGII